MIMVFWIGILDFFIDIIDLSVETYFTTRHQNTIISSCGCQPMKPLVNTSMSIHTHTHNINIHMHCPTRIHTCMRAYIPISIYTIYINATVCSGVAMRWCSQEFALVGSLFKQSSRKINSLCQNNNKRLLHHV